MEEALRALLSIVGAVAVVFLAPLAFMLIFSIVSGFNERPIAWPDERPTERPSGGE